MDKFEELGLEENILVIFILDNGGVGYIGIFGVNDFYWGYKIIFFEGGIYVFYFMKWLVKIVFGMVSDEVFYYFDIWVIVVVVGGV